MDGHHDGRVEQIMVNNEHEFVVSVGVAETWGASGTPGIADQFTTITPQLFIGKGFGDIPWDWARPIAITGQINYNVPTVAAVYDNGVLVSQNPTSLFYGFTLQYSLLYMNGYVQEVPDILRNLIPTFEGNFTTPVSNIGPSVSERYPERMKPPAWSARGSTTWPMIINSASMARSRSIEAAANIRVSLRTWISTSTISFPNTLGKPIFGGEQSTAFDPWHAFNR